MSKRTKLLVFVPLIFLQLIFLIRYLANSTFDAVLYDLGRGAVAGIAFFAVILVLTTINCRRVLRTTPAPKFDFDIRITPPK